MAAVEADSSGAGKRVLLTGARGFTGEPLRKALEAAGYSVIGTVVETAGPGERVLDLTSAADCAALVDEIAPAYVIHLAAISFVQHADAAEFYRVNVVGTTNLLDALSKAPRTARKVVLASSANIYGNIGGALIAETQPPAPANHYAASKMAMEAMAATYFDRLPIVITRPFNYTGVGQSPSFLVPKIVSHFARGERRIELGNTDIERDFSDVTMVVDAYRRLLRSKASGTAFNICTGHATSLRAIVALMEDIAGYSIDVVVNPAFVRANDIRQLTGDPRLLTDTIGPLDLVPLRTTLERMYRAMRA